jgi:hypothetical protein
VQLKVKKRGDKEITEAHLHCAPVGVDGPIVATVLASITGNYHGRTEIRFSLTNANLVSSPSPINCENIVIDSIADLFDAMHAGNIYANVHTTEFTGGAIRGQFRED